MNASITNSLLILPVPDLEITSAFYESYLNFKAVKYLNVKELHICLYRDAIEIVLIKSNLPQVEPNRILHKTGSGCDGYFTSEDVELLYNEFQDNGLKIMKHLDMTDYGNREFVIEDINKRWIGFGMKQKSY